MAFGKKKDEETPPVNLFAEEAAAAESVNEEAGTPAAGQAAEAAPRADDAAQEAAPAADEAPKADPLAGGTDALLSLFQEDEGMTEDRGAILDIAGDVEMSDLLDDLRTLAVALRIDVRGVSST